MKAHQNASVESSRLRPSLEITNNNAESRASVFSDIDEMELTAELLQIGSEKELDHFLGDLISRAGRAVGKLVKSPVGRAIGNVLKNVVKVGLPIAAGAVGTVFGGPLGGMAGSGLASMLTQALGMEIQGLPSEERDFEAALQFVRFAGNTVRNGLQVKTNGDPDLIAKAAARKAAINWEPTLLDSIPSRGTLGGRWVRDGSNVIVSGL